MSLINCKECNKEISNEAVSCPHCGFPGRPQKSTEVELTRKKWKVTILISFLIFLGGVILFLKNIFEHGFESIGTGIGITFIFLGLLGFLVGKFGSWWTNR